MGTILYWGSLVVMTVCGGVFIYGIIVLIKNWKTAVPEKRAATIKGLGGLVSLGIICFIVFTIVGIFHEPFPKEPIKIKPKFDVNIKIEDGPKLFLTVKSNLPNETKLMIALRDIETDNFSHQASGEIKDGIVVVGPFTNVVPGKHILDITVPLISLQKQSVKNILGNKGENLIGNLVKDDGDSKIVNARVTIEIPE